MLGEDIKGVFLDWTSGVVVPGLAKLATRRTLLAAGEEGVVIKSRNVLQCSVKSQGLSGIP